MQAAASALATLDTAATDCLGDIDSAVPQACASFQAALDGEPLSRYIESCRAATAWRDALVTASQGNAIATPAAEQTLELLLRTEFLCAEDALRKRTTSVAQAYGRLQRNATQSPGQRPEASLQQRLETERRRLQQALQVQSGQRLDATRQQQQQLELELLRQQLP